MSSSPSQVCSAPFDAIADRYDETFTDSLIGQAQRAAVSKELERVFRPGQRVLEIGCGTGVDACFLAERNVSVLACDSSPRMVELTSRRIEMKGMQRQVEARLLAAENIDTLSSEAKFDGAFSNFGALNCVPDLATFADQLGNLLHARAVALLCLMGPFCVWELAWYMMHGRPKKSLRRFKQGGVTARLGDGPPVHVYYPRVRALARMFAPTFRLIGVKGIGVVVPPSYVEPLASSWPRLLRLGAQGDRFLGCIPGVRLLADHILLTFERELL